MSSEGPETSSETKMEILDDMIEQLRCCVCKGYLSCSPLRLLPDGNSICGRCTPPNNDGSIYRMLALENAFNKITFPCRFKAKGCLERLPFGQVFQHETACQYQTFTCFALPFGSCTWEGPLFEVVEHFSENHSEYLMEENELKVNVEKDSEEGMYIFQKHDVITVFEYSYNSENKELKYCIRYLAGDIPKPFYRVKVYDGEDRNSYFVLKQNACKRYCFDVTQLKNETLLNLKPHLEILGNPNIIVLLIDLTVENSLINYDLLETLKCPLCGIYVTPPVYKRESGELICSMCANENKICTLNEDGELKKIMDQVDYPCRWQKCKVIKKCNTIRKHEMECLFRVFNCAVLGCNKTYKRGGALVHFQEYHDHEYFVDTFSWRFHSSYKLKHYLFTVKEDEAIVITCAIENSTFTYGVNPIAMDSYFTVYLQHDCCLTRSEHRCTVNEIYIPTIFCCYENSNYRYNVRLTANKQPKCLD